MQQDNSHLAAFSLMLMLVAQTLGFYTMQTYDLPLHSIQSMFIVHFGGAFIGVALLAAFFNKTQLPSSGFLAPLPLLLIASSIVLVISQYFSAIGVAPVWVQPAFIGFFWPLSMYVFFRNTSRRRQGLTIALSLAVGELAWLAIIPLVQHDITVATPGFAPYIHKIQALIQGCLALALAYLFSINRSTLQASVERQSKSGNGSTLNYTGETPSNKLPIIALLIGGLLFYLIFGLASGMAYVKGVIRLTSPENTQILLILLLPVFGLLLDKSTSSRWGSIIMLVALSAFGIALPLLEQYSLAHEALLSVFGCGKVLCLLNLLVLGARIVESTYIPFISTVIYTLPNATLLGSWVSRVHFTGKETTTTLAISTLVLILSGIAFMLYRHKKHTEAQLYECAGDDSEKLPHAPDLTLPEKSNTQPIFYIINSILNSMPADEKDKLQSFAIQFALTSRETIILGKTLQQAPLSEIATTLSLTESSVKYHLRLLLNKTATINRRDLMVVYHQWQNNCSA